MGDVRRGKTGSVVTTHIISIVSTYCDRATMWHYCPMILCFWQGMNMDAMQSFVAGEESLGEWILFS